MHSVLVNTLPGSTLGGISDSNTRLIRLARKALPRARFFTSLRDMLRGNQQDALFLCTPAHTHLPLVQEAFALEPSIPVFVEKPLAPTLAEAVQIARLARQNGVPSMVGLQRRFVGTFQATQSALERGVVGKPLFFRAWHFSDGTMKEGEGWRFARETGGVTLEWGVHLFAMLHWLFGEPSAVRASRRRVVSTEVEDYAQVSLSYSSGITGIAEVGWSVRMSSPPDLTVEVYGTEGAIRVSEDRLVVSTDVTTDKRFRHGISVVPCFDLTPPVPFLFGRPEFVIQDLTFLNCVRDHREPPNSFSEVAPVHRVIDLVRRTSLE